MPRLSPVNQARWARFRHNRRGYWSLWIFAVLFVLSMCSELIANDKPLLVHFNDRWYVPVLANYSESDFGGPFATPAEYQDPWLRQQIEQHGWALWAPVRLAQTALTLPPRPLPFPALHAKLAGNGCQRRRCAGAHPLRHAYLLLFGLMLTLFSSVMGVVAGAVQGYYGGKIDLWGQRVIEVWSGMPTLFLIILLSSVVQPNFWWLLASPSCSAGWRWWAWCARNFCAPVISTIFAPRRRWGERPRDHLPPYAAQRRGGHPHLPAVYSVQLHHHPHLAGFSRLRATAGFAVARRTAAAGQEQPAGAVVGIAAFLSVAVLLSLLIFIGEAVRDAFDPNKAV
jgi:microcin C transport system permease protein